MSESPNGKGRGRQVGDPFVPEEPTQAVRDFFGPAFSDVAEYARMLEDEGELRGLLGPRDMERIWSRHIVNSAAVLDFMPRREGREVLDVGSGSGLPGIVIAACRPDLHVHLAEPMARLMARARPPAWEPDAVAFVPASSAARRHRGFDHAELLARGVAQRLDLPCVSPLARPRTRDQRSLSRRARMDNTAGRFEALPGATVPERILLVDDVCTTGATLFDATDALRRAGAARVWCLAFARVW